MAPDPPSQRRAEGSPAAAPKAAPGQRCLVVIGSLGRGGAERQAVLTAAALDAAGLPTLLHVARPPFHLLDDARSAGLELDLPAPGETNPGQLRRLRSAAEHHGANGVITFLAGPSMRFLTVRAVSPAARCLPWIVAERGNTHSSWVLRSPLRGLLHARCLRAADRVAVNSSALASNVFTFAEGTGQKTGVVPNILVPFDADADRARDAVQALIGREGRGPILGAVGSFHADRNYGLLAEAFALVRGHHPRAHLVIVGRDVGPGCGPSAERFNDWTRRLGIDERVTLAGEIAGARSLLPGFDAVVLSSRLEGSSNALAEALAVGAAVAATPAGDAEQLASGAAAISAGWTPGALAGAIGAVLAEPEAWRTRAALRGRALLEERSPSRVAARWRWLLEEAAEVAHRRDRHSTTAVSR